jgi:hypothetical protein
MGVRDCERLRQANEPVSICQFLAPSLSFSLSNTLSLQKAENKGRKDDWEEKRRGNSGSGHTCGHELTKLTINPKLTRGKG